MEEVEAQIDVIFMKIFEAFDWSIGEEQLQFIEYYANEFKKLILDDPYVSIICERCRGVFLKY